MTKAEYEEIARLIEGGMSEREACVNESTRARYRAMRQQLEEAAFWKSTKKRRYKNITEKDVRRMESRLFHLWETAFDTGHELPFLGSAKQALDAIKCRHPDYRQNRPDAGDGIVDFIKELNKEVIHAGDQNHNNAPVLPEVPPPGAVRGEQQND